MKNIIVIIVVVVVIVFAAVTFIDFRNKGKYEECTKACKDNRRCVENGPNTSEVSYLSGPCIKWNDGDCLNNCVQKYK